MASRDAQVTPISTAAPARITSTISTIYGYVLFVRTPGKGVCEIPPIFSAPCVVHKPTPLESEPHCHYGWGPQVERANNHD
eukprot:6194967-Pleurochrysis_carterae.AAC.1